MRSALTADGAGRPAAPDHVAATEARLTLEALVAGEDRRVVEIVKLVFDGYSSVAVAVGRLPSTGEWMVQPSSNLGYRAG